MEGNVVDGQKDNDVRDDISWLVVFTTLAVFYVMWGV